MSEAGGTTTQSGIYYQNSIAALYLGRLLDPSPRTAGERVIMVRVEAPEHVDDIVVRHADGSCSYIQAKESLSSTSEEWNKLWIHFAAQTEDSKNEEFHLILAIGTISVDIEHLRELCDRAKGKQNHEEWFDSLSVILKAIANKIIKVLPEKTTQAAFKVIKYVEVWIWPLNTIERDLMPIWIPTSTSSKNTLFDLLHGKVGRKARIRGVFYAAQLLDELYNDNNIKVHDVPSWGMDAYIQAIKTEMGTLTVPGTNLRGPIADLFFWIPLRDRANDNAHLDFEDEDPRWRWDRQKEIIDLRNFPYGTINRAVIDAGAGFGKTTMLHAIAFRLTSGVRIPVLIQLNALAASNMTVLGYLNDKVNTEYDVSIDWERLCESGRTVILFDGLDELSTINRTNVLNTILKFDARFQKSAYLLTVRDSSALTLPLGLPVLAICRLDDFAIRQFAEAYTRYGGSLSADMLSNHLERYPDLGHLLRIPLFLALVLASTNPKDKLPRSRTELLEHYLLLLFSPERHKVMSEPLHPLDDLREVAELLAWHGLEADGIGIAENEARRLLRGQELKEPYVYIERLVQIGVLRRSTTRLQFAYPIIQEYLAACWMIANTPKEIGPRFASISRRPWAQAIQFALEMHPDAETIIKNQLNVPDDAFNTKLRLIGRCIVNGAKVSTEVRGLVGDDLAAAWRSEAYSICHNIGYLIADGFLDPLPPKVAGHISTWALSYGGAEIIVAKQSSAFTLEILKNYIAKDLSQSYYLHGWQIAVNEIAEAALDIYLERVRDERTTEEEFNSLSSLISSLPASRLRPDRWFEIATDSSLPLIIRLAGYKLGIRPIPMSAQSLFDDIFRLSELGNAKVNDYFVYGLYWDVQDAEDKFAQMLNDINVPEKRIRSLLEGLMRSIMENETKRAILRLVMSKSNFSQNIRFLMLLCLAIWGDEAAEQETIPMLIDQDLDNVIAWLNQANKFSKKAVCDAAIILSSRPIGSNDLLKLINSADFGLSYKTGTDSFEWAVGKEPYIHPARGDMLCHLYANLKEDDESIDALTVRLQTGDTRVYERLITVMRKFVASFEGLMPYDEDNKISSTLYHLKRQNIFLPLDFLFQIIDKSSLNAFREAVDWIVRNGDEKVILKLLEYYNLRNKDYVRDTIFTGLETLAGRYGIRIIRNGSKLIIE